MDAKLLTSQLPSLYQGTSCQDGAGLKLVAFEVGNAGAGRKGPERFPKSRRKLLRVVNKITILIKLIFMCTHLSKHQEAYLNRYSILHVNYISVRLFKSYSTNCWRSCGMRNSHTLPVAMYFRSHFGKRLGSIT